jgi:hypothetical protein
MNEEPKVTEQEFHKKYAVNLFNHVWSILDKTSRTEEDEIAMIHAAHASVFHWSKIGTPNNIYVGEWQISRVYSALDHGEEALYHAQKSLDICEENDDFSPFDWAYAYEGMARAHSVNGNEEESRKYLSLAKEKGEAIKDEEAKNMLVADLEAIETKLG